LQSSALTTWPCRPEYFAYLAGFGNYVLKERQPMEDKELKLAITKLAAENPELRQHLIPLLRKSGDSRSVKHLKEQIAHTKEVLHLYQKNDFNVFFKGHVKDLKKHLKDKERMLKAVEAESK
jgi:hypothetical protein